MRDADTGPSPEERPTRPGDLFDQAATLARISERLLGEAQAPTVGRYQLLKSIGRGAMGVVYAAYDEQLDRKVALKVQAGVAADPRRREAALREGRALASLTHPNVVTIHEVGVHEDAFFLAMEFVDGEPLSRDVDGSARTSEALWVDLARVADGLAAAHAAGLVHGDVKPSNVLRARDGRIKVVDFGLARRASTGVTLREGGEAVVEEGEDTARSGVTFGGTPAYVAPEQALGEAMSARSDQYAFAVMAWELLTGELPHAARDRSRLVEHKLASAPDSSAPGAARLSRREFRALVRAMDPDPRARFSDLGALVLAARPDRRWRAWALGGSAVAALGVAWSLGRTEPPPPPVDPCADEVARLDAYVPAQGASVEVSPADDERTRQLRLRGKERLDLAAKRWRTLARRACESHGRGETSDAVYLASERCLGRGTKVIGAFAESLSAEPFNLQRASSDLLNLVQIESCGPHRRALIERDIGRGEAPFGSDNPALGLANKAGGLWGHKKKDEARELLPALRDNARSSKDVLARAESWRQIGLISPDQSERVDALGKALALGMEARLDHAALAAAADLANALAENPAGRAEARRTLGLVSVWGESIVAGEDGEHLREGLAPFLGRIHNVAGILASDDGELEAARKSYLEALRSWEPDRMWRPFRSVQAMNNLALLATQRGDDEAALSHYTRAIELIDSRIGRESWFYQVVSTNRAEAALTAGRPELTRKALLDAEESRQQREPGSTRSPAEHLLWARLDWEEGKVEAAAEGFELACAGFEKRGQALQLASCEAWLSKAGAARGWSPADARASIERGRKAGAGHDLLAEFQALGAEGAMIAGQLVEARAFVTGAREAASEAAELSDALRVRLDLVEARLEIMEGNATRAQTLLTSARTYVGERPPTHPLRVELEELSRKAEHQAVTEASK